MNFDVKNSKLFAPIMAALVSFFELDNETATETDVHAKLDGLEPLSTLIEKASTEAVAGFQKELDDLKTQVTTMQDQVTTLTARADEAEKSVATKDARISELQVEISEKETAIDQIKKQHGTETANLSGQIAKLKAGKSLEADLVDDVHPAGTKDKNKGGNEEMVIVSSSRLQKLVQKRPMN